MATHFSILAWEIPWTEEPGRLQSVRSQSQMQLSTHTLGFQTLSLQKCLQNIKSCLQVGVSPLPHLQNCLCTRPALTAL